MKSFILLGITLLVQLFSMALAEQHQGPITDTAAPAPAPATTGITYSGNDPAILSLIAMLKRNGFTTDEDLREVGFLMLDY